jgi:hypothetical protein
VWGKPRTQARKAAMHRRTIVLDPVHVLVTKVMAYAESTGERALTLDQIHQRVNQELASMLPVDGRA